MGEDKDEGAGGVERTDRSPGPSPKEGGVTCWGGGGLWVCSGGVSLVLVTLLDQRLPLTP